MPKRSNTTPGRIVYIKYHDRTSARKESVFIQVAGQCEPWLALRSVPCLPGGVSATVKLHLLLLGPFMSITIHWYSPESSSWALEIFSFEGKSTSILTLSEVKFEKVRFSNTEWAIKKSAFGPVDLCCSVCGYVAGERDRVSAGHQYISVVTWEKL